ARARRARARGGNPAHTHNFFYPLPRLDLRPLQRLRMYAFVRTNATARPSMEPRVFHLPLFAFHLPTSSPPTSPPPHLLTSDIPHPTSHAHFLPHPRPRRGRPPRPRRPLRLPGGHRRPRRHHPGRARRVDVWPRRPSQARRPRLRRLRPRPP